METFDLQTLKQLNAYLNDLVTDNKKRRLTDVINQRTRHMTIALENIFQPHNISAVIRSCECFGIQDLHIIESERAFKVNHDIALGSAQWLNINNYKHAPGNTEKCLTDLKKQGYKIAAMTLSDKSIALKELPVDEKFALCIGSEETGLSDTALAMADHHVKIPMVGFTQSFNLSVTAALSFYELADRIKQSHVNWQLSELEIQTILYRWHKQSIPSGDKMAAHYIEKNNIKDAAI